MRQKRKLAEHVSYQTRLAVMLLSSVAGSMPPHRGTVFNQRPKHNLLCLVRALPLVGGDAYIQRGGFYAAAPWRGIQSTHSTFRAQCWVGTESFHPAWRILCRRTVARCSINAPAQLVVPVSGAVVGWGMSGVTGTGRRFSWGSRGRFPPLNSYNNFSTLPKK
jgi:hypothetical protein